MNRLLLLAIAGVMLFVTSGCTTGATLRGRAMEIQAINKSIHDRAYNCAPKQLAFSESNVEFGLYELRQGNFVKARNHLDLAEQNARQADQLSDHEECLDNTVAIVVEKTPTVKIEPKPSDQDGDGILDNVDQCPVDPEDFDTFEDEDGCPDKDNDKDGILDPADVCLFVPEDVDGFQDNDGCPEIDNDLDGIADINDQCPDKAEDFDGFQDDDGCPDNDNDGDGIADVLDQCPEEPEVYNGNKDDDGCPDKESKAKIEGDQIKLNEKVFFKTAKADILPQSFGLLDDVVAILRDNPNINIRVEGHTDSRGSDKSNKKLSDARASSVRLYLIERGIDPSRIESIGYGEERPIDDNSTEAGRATNRRVEIHITKQ
ncbi:MAG: OmpA family protein [bacterium]